MGTTFHGAYRKTDPLQERLRCKRGVGWQGSFSLSVPRPDVDQQVCDIKRWHSTLYYAGSEDNILFYIICLAAMRHAGSIIRVQLMNQSMTKTGPPSMHPAILFPQSSIPLELTEPDD
jgi:hypothetical protein